MTFISRHGLAIEARAKKTILSVPGVKELNPNKQDLLQSLSRLYTDKILVHLKEEGYRHWGCVPTSEVLDRVFGIDLLISFHGHWLALDITSRWNDVGYKQTRFKDRNKRKFFSVLDLDTASVLYTEDGLFSQERAKEILTQMTTRHRFGDVVEA